MNYKGTLFVFLFLFCTPAVFSFSQTDSLLHELSQTIKNRELYVKEKQDRIMRLQHLLTEDNLSLIDQFNVYNKLYNEYRAFKFDSAFTYALKLQETAHQLDDSTRVTYAKLKLSFTLLSSGMFKETFDSLNTVNLTHMPDSIKVEYYDLSSRANYDLAAYNADDFYADRYIERGNRYLDSALTLVDKNSLQYYYLSGMKRLKEKNYEDAKKDFQLILDKLNPSSYHQYAITASLLASVYKENGETAKAIDMMIMAAIADIKSATKEAIALMNLAELLYNNGGERRAYPFIKQALEDADFYGARLRKIQVAAILPIIEGERLATAESQRSRLLVYAIAVSVLSLLVVAFAYIIFKQLKQLRQAKITVTEANESLYKINKSLVEANRIKEEYIGYSFNLYSGYIDKIKQFKSAVDKKLMTKKLDEIGHVMKSINLRKERGFIP